MSVSADSSTATQTDSVSMTNTEEDATLADTEVEYLTQYFGFLPQSFMNGMYNSMLEYLKEAMKTLNEAILSAYKDKISEAELKEVSSKQGQAAVQKLDRLFDKAETYLNINVFSLPSNLILPEDRPQVENPCSEEEMKDLDRQLKETKDKIMAVKLANSVLRQKISDMDSLQKNLNSSLEYIQKVHNTVAEESNSLQKTVDENNEIVKTIQEFETLVMK